MEGEKVCFCQVLACRNINRFNHRGTAVRRGNWDLLGSLGCRYGKMEGYNFNLHAPIFGKLFFYFDLISKKF